MTEKTVGRQEAGLRLDKYLGKIMPGAPASFFYRMLRAKNITVNRKKCSGKEVLCEGDAVMFFLSEETMTKFGWSGDRKPLRQQQAVLDKEQIIYCDRDVLLFSKPAGVLSQKAAPDDISANEQVIAYCLAEGIVSQEDLAAAKPSVCNRLDRNTSGLMLAGLSIKGLQFLSEIIRDHSLKKIYYAVVSGRTKPEGEFSSWMFKDERKNISQVKNRREDFPENQRDKAVQIRMSYQTVAAGEEASYLRIHLKTGKSHQIRACFAQIGHPLIGDPKYGQPKENQRYRTDPGVSRQLLHAGEVVFPKLTGDFAGLSEKTFTAPLPDDMKRALDYFHLRQSRTSPGNIAGNQEEICRPGKQED